MAISSKLKSVIFFLILLSYHTILAAIDNSIIQKIQANLAKIDKAAIDFLQTDRSGTIAEGVLFIEKPFFFRCNYYDPYPLLIVSGKKFISIYDYEMETLSRLETSDNIISILFQNNWIKNKSFKIINTSETAEQFILRVYYSDDSQKADLFFDKHSLNLGQIHILERNEPNIVINFSKPVHVKNFRRDLFEIRSPAIFGKPKQFNRQEIEKLYDRK